MQITLTGQHVEVTAALKQFAEEKFQKLERHCDGLQSIQVVFKVEKLQQIAEATLLTNKTKLHASAASEDLYASIDLLIDKLDRQLVKHKEKMADAAHGESS